MHYTQQLGIAGVTLDDIYLGNGASELIVMATNALLDDGDELLVPMPDYPLWTAVSLSGGTPVRYRCDEDAGWLPDLDDMRAKITPAHARHRGHQPEQPDVLYPDSPLRGIIDRARAQPGADGGRGVYDSVRRRGVQFLDGEPVHRRLR